MYRRIRWCIGGRPLLVVVAVSCLAGEGAAQEWRLGGAWHEAGARLMMLGTSGGACHDVAVLGNRAYVASGLGVLVFDITNPTTLEPIASWPLTSSSQPVSTDGRLVYVGTAKSGLYVFDTACDLYPPTRPTAS